MKEDFSELMQYPSNSEGEESFALFFTFTFALQKLGGSRRGFTLRW
jgi:hypothetical protein